MPPIQWSDVVGVAPQLATVAPLWQTAVVNYVNTALDVELWGSDGGEESPLYIGRVLLAAHLASFPGMATRGTTGAVTSETIGPITRTFAQSSTSQNLQLTSYGAQLDEMIGMLGIVPWMVI